MQDSAQVICIQCLIQKREGRYLLYTPTMLSLAIYGDYEDDIWMELA